MSSLVLLCSICSTWTGSSVEVQLPAKGEVVRSNFTRSIDFPTGLVTLLISLGVYRISHLFFIFNWVRYEFIYIQSSSLYKSVKYGSLWSIASFLWIFFPYLALCRYPPVLFIQPFNSVILNKDNTISVKRTVNNLNDIFVRMSLCVLFFTLLSL